MDEENIKNSIKHDVKTSFLIANSFNALIGGLFPLSVGTMVVLSEGFIPPLLYFLAIGVPVAGFVSIGFYAAFKENKKMLNIYSVLMGMVVAMETLIVAAAVLPSDNGADMFVVNFLILHTGITYSVLMGMVVAMETLIVAAAVLPSDNGADMFVVNFLILHTGITLAAMALAIYLAKQIPSIETPKSPTSGLGHCLKYFGYGVVVVLVVGYSAEYFLA